MRSGHGPKVALDGRIVSISFAVLVNCWNYVGAVMELLFWSMSVLMPEVHSWTCGLMYVRNASDDHRPRIIILCTDSSARNNAMAAPDRREWEPMSAACIVTKLSRWFHVASIAKCLIGTFPGEVQVRELLDFCVKYRKRVDCGVVVHCWIG